MSVKKKNILILFSIIFFNTCMSGGSAKNIPVERDRDYCKTKYPVLLVHGLGFRDDNVIIRYWGKIVDHLKKKGAAVILSRQQAYSSHEDNAKLIQASIMKFFDKHPEYEKVNIIAHSKGGIESRYMISMLGMEGRVASLTTLATPHRGSKVADEIMNKVGSERNSIVKIINALALLAGDPVPDAYDAGQELTTTFMENFNKAVRDKDGVLYQSYTGIIDGEYPNPLWRKLWENHNRLDGPNDGLVSLRSAKWGEFRGIVTHKNRNVVSHADIIGMHQVTGVFDFIEEDFMAEVVHELKVKGL